MIQLSDAATPRWVDLGRGVRAHVLPVTTEVMMAARAELRADEPEADDADAADLRGVAMARAVARRVLVDWKGVADAKGKPAPVTPENIDALLAHWWLWEAWAVKVFAPALGLVDEKNVSAPSLTGTSAGAPNTVLTARKPARSARAK